MNQQTTTEPDNETAENRKLINNLIGSIIVLCVICIGNFMYMSFTIAGYQAEVQELKLENLDWELNYHRLEDEHSKVLDQYYEAVDSCHKSIFGFSPQDYQE